MESEDKTPGRRAGSESRGSFVSSMTSLGSTTVTVFEASTIPFSTSKTVINEGIWSSYSLRGAAEGIFGSAWRGEKCVAVMFLRLLLRSGHKLATRSLDLPTV